MMSVVAVSVFPAKSRALSVISFLPSDSERFTLSSVIVFSGTMFLMLIGFSMSPVKVTDLMLASL